MEGKAAAKKTIYNEVFRLCLVECKNCCSVVEVCSQAMPGGGLRLSEIALLSFSYIVSVLLPVPFHGPVLSIDNGESIDVVVQAVCHLVAIFLSLRGKHSVSF